MYGIFWSCKTVLIIRRRIATGTNLRTELLPLGPEETNTPLNTRFIWRSIFDHRPRASGSHWSCFCCCINISPHTNLQPTTRICSELGAASMAVEVGENKPPPPKKNSLVISINTFPLTNIWSFGCVNLVVFRLGIWMRAMMIQGFLIIGTLKNTSPLTLLLVSPLVLSLSLFLSLCVCVCVCV